MTRDDLTNLRFMNGRITVLKAKIHEKEIKILSLKESLQPGTMNYDATPKAPGAKDRISEVVQEIDKVEREIRVIEIQIADIESVQSRIRRELNFALSEFGDVQIEDAINLHFIEGKSWLATATAIGSPSIADTIKHRVHYFIRKTDTEEFKKSFSKRQFSPISPKNT